ncbi:hypothetical protein [Acidithiobacillus ferriphilus]|uniref:hypothetical protein n=1 Tax=Acidithiobacillus ferriphilus TaxID=1689834 RepID=UPI002DBA22B2|nr:hypothetical protein [Acidithiobacillus ferriphilus]MEB8535515.1 hypothetical protein [Acidithiobacillus ferriphilus]
MGYMIEDEEHDALEQAPFDARWMYMSLRKKMDFATGIVGGPKRRISWAEVAGMVALEHQQGRKAIPADVSRARRLMASLEKCGAVERHTSLKDRYLVLYLPLARSDNSEAAKRQGQSYQAALAEAVEETQNCVGMDIYRARRSVTAGAVDTTLQVPQSASLEPHCSGRFAAGVTRETEIRAVESREPTFPSSASKTANGSGPFVLDHPVATDMPAGLEGQISHRGDVLPATEPMALTPASEVRQTSDRPVPDKSDRPIEPISSCLNNENRTACEEVRQTSDRPVPEKSDRPIEPISSCLNNENRTACEEVRQTSDRPVPEKSDRHVTNPFTPNLYINLDIPTAPAPAHIHAGAASVVQVFTEPPAGHQPERPAGGTDPARIRGAVQDTLPNPQLAGTPARSVVNPAGGVKPKTCQSAPPEVPQSRVRQNLDNRLVTVAVDDDSGVSVQVSPAFAAKHPDRLRELLEIFSACAAGVAPPDFGSLPADLPAGIGDGHEGGLQ